MDEVDSQEIENLMAFAMGVIKDGGKEALVYYRKGRPDTRFDEELDAAASVNENFLFDPEE